MPAPRRRPQTPTPQQHHDAITGTAKQAVANDYHRMLATGWDDAARAIAASLRRLLLADDGPAPASGGAGSRRRPLAWGGGAGGARREMRPAAGTGAAAAAGSSGALPAGRQPPGQPPLHDLQLLHCPLLNASVCPATVGLPAPEGGLLVVVYNPLGSHRAGVVRLPVAPGAGDASWSVQGAGPVAMRRRGEGHRVAEERQEVVTGCTPAAMSSPSTSAPADSEGAAADAQLLTVSGATRRLQRALLDAGADAAGFGAEQVGRTARAGARLRQKVVGSGICGPSPFHLHHTLAFSRCCPPSQELAFAVDLPPLGYETYLIKPPEQPSEGPSGGGFSSSSGGSSSGSSSGSSRGGEAAEGVADAGDDCCGDSSGSSGGATEGASPGSDCCADAIESSSLRLEFSRRSGRLTALAAADGSWRVALSQEVLAYTSSTGDEGAAPTADEQDGQDQVVAAAAGGGQHAAATRAGRLRGGQASGAYIFRPAGPAAPLAPAGGRVELEVVKGPLLSELRQCWTPWACLTTRLGCAGGRRGLRDGTGCNARGR
jgi:hypothetical protein